MDSDSEESSKLNTLLNKNSQDENDYESSMNLDDVLEELGELGRFQITTYLLVCLPILFCGANSLSYVFTAGIPEYRCFVPECENITNPKFNENWVPFAIPNDEYNKTSTCTRFSYNEGDEGCVAESFTNNIEHCNKWVYGEERTIVNDWDITCRENQWKLSLVGNCHFVGIFFGSFMFGVLSDRYGRKYMFLLSILIMSVAGISHVFATNYISFLVSATLHAVGTAGVYPLGFVIGVELVGRKKREFTGVVLNFFYAVGEALLGVVAGFTQDWVLTQLIVSAPCLIFMIYYFYVPESIRWLIAQQKHEKASGIIRRAAKINKVTLSKNTVDNFSENSILNTGEVKDKPRIGPMLYKVITSKILVLRYITIFFIWAANAFIYYGMSLNSTSMIGNKYLNFILVCLIEIPGYLFSWIAILKVGRKYALVSSLFICSINCAISIFINPDLTWLLITLYLIGKLSITASFGIIYVYTAEIFPTIIRSGGVATASTFARLGAFLAPFIPLLGFYIPFLPMVLFASIAFLAALLGLTLPETLDKKLPETFEDALNI